MELIQQVKGFLSETVNGLPRALCAFLATCDGHLIEFYGREDLANEDLMPMASSILGLGRTLSGGLEKDGKLDDLIIRSQGKVLSLVGVQDDGDVLFVGIVAERMVNLGLMLVKGRACADQIRTLN